MNERSEKQRNQSRKWHASRAIEESLEDPEVVRAVEWLRTHPPGARLPDHLEPGYNPDDEEEV
jgi:hypothetical protein